MAMALSNPATATSPRIRSRCLSAAISPLALSSKSAFCGQSLVTTVSSSGRQSRRAYSGVRASASEIPKQFRKEGLKEGCKKRHRPLSFYMALLIRHSSQSYQSLTARQVCMPSGGKLSTMGNSVIHIRTNWMYGQSPVLSQPDEEAKAASTSRRKKINITTKLEIIIA